ncbi:MAG: hypothetical protein GX910_04810 [Clostridiaceae bacterium]|jgi:hypothetical protein|nr:hypothetical protein [Clostridiaceae bacterium]
MPLNGHVWYETDNSPFYRRVDMGNIGLIGHSRDGEAIAIASLFNKMMSFPE